MNENTNYLLVASYAILAGLWGLSQKVLVPVPINVVATSTAIVYIGCHRSLRLRDPHDEEGNVKSAEDREVMTQKDAMKFPLVGSCALFGLYLLFKFLDKDLVNLLLSLYFSAIGCFTIGVSLDPFVRAALGAVMSAAALKKQFGKVLKLPVLGDLDLRVTFSETLSLICGAVFSFYYFKTKHWTLNNIFGISFCIQGMERISIGSYKIGAILLSGLFFYDIFWVFGTEVMVTVAKSFDGPIKLLFPRAWATEEAKAQFSMLGLGDIVIPGVFVALLLRYDAHKADERTFSDHALFPKPFFNANITGYALGLATTLFVMYQFNAAQPALLYLVPACLGASLLVALSKGQFKELLAYSEEEEEEKDGDKKKGEEGKKDK